MMAVRREDSVDTGVRPSAGSARQSCSRWLLIVSCRPRNEAQDGGFGRACKLRDGLPKTLP